MRACLSENQVRCTIGDVDDDTDLVIREFNNANAARTFTLSMQSYRGDLISARFTEETLIRPITEAQSLERLELLANASTHGAKLFATGGGHATSYDLFKSVEIPVWGKQSRHWRIRR